MPSRLGQAAPNAALGAALAVFAALAWSWRGYTPDDAFIFLRYAANAAEGRGLVFNPGERVQGYTSALWTLILAAAAIAGAPLVVFAKAAGVALGAGCLVIAQAIARRIDARAAIAAPLVLAGFIDLPYWSVSGMDAALFAFVVAGAMLLTLRAREGDGSAVAAAIAWGAAGVARPEGVAFGAIALFWLARANDERRISPWPWIAFIAPIAVWAAFAWVYYGDPLPNTYWAKRFDRVESFRRGLVLLRAFSASNDGVFIAAAVALAVVLRRHAAVVLCLWLLAFYGAYLLWSGGDSWVSPNALRFAVPVLVPVSVAMAAGFSGLIGAIPAGGPRRLAAVAAGLVLAAWLVPPAGGLITRPVGGDPSVIAHLQTNAAPDDRLAVTDIGNFAYWTDLAVIDTFGLVDRHVARSFRKRTNSSYAAGEDLKLVDYVLARAPRWIILKGTAGRDGLEIADETGAPAIFADPRFQRKYRFVLAGTREPYVLFERIARSPPS